jgi:monoamine oxidase
MIFDTCIENHVRRKHRFPEFKIEMLYPKSGDRFLEPEHLYKIMREFDKYSFRQFLADEAKLNGHELTQGARNMICGILSHEMQMSTSMAAIIAQVIAFNAKDYVQIKGGMDRLPKSILKGRADNDQFPNLEEAINYNCRVIKIAELARGLRVHFRNSITEVVDADDFDLVIVCVPFSAFRHIQMGMLASPRKRRAVCQLHYVNACKILLEFRHRFWEDEMVDRPSIKGGHSITDLPIRHIYYPSPGQYESRIGSGLLLASYTWGDDSLRWTSLKPEDRIRFALRDLEQVHDLEGGLERDCIGGMSHSWAEDEFTSGAFAHFEQGQLTELFPDVWYPENGIHYAGEHTSTKHAWIEGAVESGIRAAKEVCDVAAASPRG